jgi:cobalt-zinc-cadmium efflux system membrane fusion protein
MKLSSHTFFLILGLIAVPGWAQDAIPLAPADVTRLGIVFAPVGTAAGGSGPRFPATVVSSPEGAANLTVPFGGVIESWLLAPGAPVRAGEAVARIRSQEVLPVQQEWMAAVTAREGARFELEKSQRLLAEGIISAQRLNQAQRAHEQAVFAEQAAAGTLLRVGFTPERLQALRSRGEGLGRYELLAIADGVIARRIRATGDFAEANSAVILLRPGGSMWVSMQVPARAAAALAVGQVLKSSSAADKLVLRQKDSSIDGDSQTVGILAEFEGETGYLPGQILAVELLPPADGMLVAGSAVVHSGDETTVFVRTASGVVARTLPLLPMGSDYLARSGLAAGDEVVVRGAAVLKGIKAGLGRSE